MKKNIVIVAGVLFGIYLLLKVTSTSKVRDTNSSSGNELALREIKKEPKVKEAILTDANVLYVSVIDDGTSQNGYASYICEILHENNADANRVKVVKVNSTNDPNRDNAYGILLGESLCK